MKFLKICQNDINVMISQLNIDQLEVFKKVTYAIQAQINGVTDDSAATVHLFVSAWVKVF